MSAEAQIPITDTPLTIGGRELRSRLILGTGGFPRLETLADAIRATRTELVTVALRRIDAAARGSLVDVLDGCGVDLLPNTAGCFTARDAVLTAQARPRGLRDRLGQARGHRRRPHAAARRARAAARRRGAGRRRLHRAALHQRRPDPRAPPGGRRLRGGDAARLADRLGHRHPQPVQHRADRRARRRAGDPRRRRRHRVATPRWRWSSAATACSARARSPVPRTRSRWRTRSVPRSRPGASPGAPGASRAACTPRPRRPTRAWPI